MRRVDDEGFWKLVCERIENDQFSRIVCLDPLYPDFWHFLKECNKDLVEGVTSAKHIQLRIHEYLTRRSIEYTSDLSTVQHEPVVVYNLKRPERVILLRMGPDPKDSTSAVERLLLARRNK